MNGVVDKDVQLQEKDEQHKNMLILLKELAKELAITTDELKKAQQEIRKLRSKLNEE